MNIRSRSMINSAFECRVRAGRDGWGDRRWSPRPSADYQDKLTATRRRRNGLSTFGLSVSPALLCHGGRCLWRLDDLMHARSLPKVPGTFLPVFLFPVF